MAWCPTTITKSQAQHPDSRSKLPYRIGDVLTYIFFYHLTQQILYDVVFHQARGKIPVHTRIVDLIATRLSGSRSQPDSPSSGASSAEHCKYRTIFCVCIHLQYVKYIYIYTLYSNAVVYMRGVWGECLFFGVAHIYFRSGCHACDFLGCGFGNDDICLA